MIKLALWPIRLYKTFIVNDNIAVSPYLRHTWGRLYENLILTADRFDSLKIICVHGVHASKLLNDAKLISNEHNRQIWEVVIPFGTRYYKSTPQEARLHFHFQAKGSQFRANKVKLIRRVE